MLVGLDWTPQTDKADAYFRYHGYADVQDIELKSVDERPHEEAVWHNLIITDNDGAEVEITLFGDDAERLIDKLKTAKEEAILPGDGDE